MRRTSSCPDIIGSNRQAFPEIIYHESLNQAVVVEIGGEVQIEATIHGGPETILTWYHLDKEIHPNENLTITSTEEKTVLSIISCTEVHDGEYTLKAQNSRGFFHSFFKISVFEVRPKDIHIKPPPPDIFGAKLSSMHPLILKHPSSDITLTIPKGAVPEGVEDEVEGQILVDLNNYQHLFPDEEYLIAPIVDYNIRNKQFDKFNSHVEIRIPHSIIDANVRQNIKVYCIDGDNEPKPIGMNAAADLYYEILEKYILISLKHFTLFPCTTHGQECEMEAILRLYMATFGKPGDHTAKLSPKLLLGCAASSEFKGNIYLDPGMKIKSQRQFELSKPYECLSVSTEITQSEPWKVLKDAFYVETIEEQITPVEDTLKNRVKIPKVIALSEYMLSKSGGEKLFATLNVCFHYKDGKKHLEKIQFEEDFSTQAAKGPVEHQVTSVTVPSTCVSNQSQVVPSTSQESRLLTCTASNVQQEPKAAALSLSQLQREEIQRVLSCGSDDKAVLQVTDESSQDDIKRSYKRLSLLLHPDKNKHEGAAEAFKAISQSYMALTRKDGQGTQQTEVSPEEVFKSFYPDGYPVDPLGEESVLLELASKIGPEWYELGTRLGISPIFLDNLTSSGAHQALPLRMLHCWMRQCPNNQEQKSKLTEAIQRCPDIRDRESLIDLLSHHHGPCEELFPDIANLLHLCWEKFGRLLGLSQTQLDGIKVTAGTPDEEKAKFKMLLHWKHNKKSSTEILLPLQQAGRQDLVTWLGDHCGLVSIASIGSVKQGEMVALESAKGPAIPSSQQKQVSDSDHSESEEPIEPKPVAQHKGKGKGKGQSNTVQRRHTNSNENVSFSYRF